MSRLLLWGWLPIAEPSARKVGHARGHPSLSYDGAEFIAVDVAHVHARLEPSEVSLFLHRFLHLLGYGIEDSQKACQFHH